MHSVLFLKPVLVFCGEREKVSLTSLCVNFLIGSFCSFTANAKIMLYIELLKPLSDLPYSLSPQARIHLQQKEGEQIK